MKMSKKKGMTLIELIAAIAIFSLVSVFLVSIITTALKFNIANKTTFDANSNSRAFYEAIRQHRPNETKVYPSDGKYVIYFNNQNELLEYVKEDFNSSMIETRVSTFQEIKNDALSNRYAILLDIKKIEEADTSNPTKKYSYYELTTSSWDLEKGEFTQIDRKSLIAEG